MMMWTPLVFSLVLGGFFIFDNEQEPFWRIAAAVYLAACLLLPKLTGLPQVVSLAMESAFVIVMVCYYRFTGSGYLK